MVRLPSGYLRALLKGPMGNDFQRIMIDCISHAGIDAAEVLNKFGSAAMMRHGTASLVPSLLHEHIKERVNAGDLPFKVIEYSAGAPGKEFRPCAKYQFNNLMIFIKKTDNPTDCPIEAQIRKDAYASNQMLLWEENPEYEQEQEINIFITYGMAKLKPTFLNIGIPGPGRDYKWFERYSIRNVFVSNTPTQLEPSVGAIDLIKPKPKLREDEIGKVST